MNTTTEELPTLADVDAAPAGAIVATADGSIRERLNDFYELTKPRMNFLVVITTMVGFYVAMRPNTPWVLLVHTLIGTALTAASSAVMNQFVERGYDALMPRTRNRPLAAGRVSLLEAVVYAAILCTAGLAYLAIAVNPLTAYVGALTVVTYLFLYTPLKRVSSLCTVVGAIPGALPPVMGFTAVENAITPGAISLFAILFIWQMPHFLAIAILYRDDYCKGGFKMLPCVDPGLSMTSRQIVLYSAALLPASLVPTTLALAGPLYFTAAVLLGLGFLAIGVRTARSRTRADARKLFFASIIYLPLLLAALMLDKP